MNNEKFSVLLSVYKKELPENFDECFHSIYTNQSLKPNEIILIKDGPLTTELEEKIDQWLERIPTILNIVNLKENQGLARALNTGLKYCSHELVARMDTDDFSYPDRFYHQIDFMIKNPEIAVSSGVIEEYDSSLKNKISQRILPLTQKDIYKFCKKRSPISHPACIFRKSIIIKEGGYPTFYPEDYALWGILLKKGYIFGNLPIKLLKMRAGDSITQRRGFNFLKGEIKTYLHFHKIGFINNIELIYGISIKSFTRLSPNWIKKILYKFAR